MEEQLGTYKITDYTVVINGASQVRQLITYYKFNGEELSAERYYGDILPGYISQ